MQSAEIKPLLMEIISSLNDVKIMLQGLTVSQLRLKEAVKINAERLKLIEGALDNAQKLKAVDADVTRAKAASLDVCADALSLVVRTVMKFDTEIASETFLCKQLADQRDQFLSAGRSIQFLHQQPNSQPASQIKNRPANQ